MGPETAEPIQEEEQEKLSKLKQPMLSSSHNERKKTLQYSQNQTNPYSNFRIKVQKQQEKKKNIIA